MFEGKLIYQVSFEVQRLITLFLMFFSVLLLVLEVQIRIEPGLQPITFLNLQELSPNLQSIRIKYDGRLVVCYSKESCFATDSNELDELLDSELYL